MLSVRRSDGSSAPRPAGQPQHAFALWSRPDSRGKAARSQLDLPFEPSSFPRYLARLIRLKQQRKNGARSSHTLRGEDSQAAPGLSQSVSQSLPTPTAGHRIWQQGAPGLAKREWHVLVLDHVLDLPLHGEEEERDEVHEEERPEHGYVEAARMQ